MAAGVSQEANQGYGGKFKRTLIRTRAPDSCRHGNEVVVSKHIRIALSLEILSDRLLVSVRGFPRDAVPQDIQSELVEADDIEDQAPHS